MKQTIVPLGPQHPVLPEPLSFDLVLEDEKVVDAIPSIGFVHRGLELLAPKRDFEEYVYVAERICGICSFMHGMGYCQAVEEVINLQLPRRANQLRTMLCELSRIHSHLLWLGLAADAFGFENLFMHSWRLREKVLDIFEEMTGGRVIFSIAKVGGLRKDISSETIKRASKVLQDMVPEIKEICGVFLNDVSVKHRLCGVAVMSAESAHKLGAVGPMLRGSGVAKDLRMTGYASYKELQWEIITEKDGDCYARCAVRVREIYQSIDMIRQLAEKLEEGPVDAKVLAAPKGETFMRLEQPRGEVVYYVRGNGTRFLERFRVRTPTFANVPAVVTLLKGYELADIPTILLTIDPCISCMER